MDNEMDLSSEVRGRIFSKTVYGDNASEIEIAALAAAQAFFGEGVPLSVVPDYEAFTTRDGRYAAHVRVRAA